ncbi:MULTISPECIES: hypothetical protein [Flavobacterium]|uniref:Lipocalin-like domain-containing protein n=1 Tax=Flavobacterium jumunjinense TaxID=998845 RepID=A0ABV5GS86_9FLAO|nr:MULTISPECIES: hypothetical protein [Flavobacterium]
MKKRILLVAITLGMSLFTTSCNNDDNEGETIVPLTGKWSISKVGVIVGETETLVDAPQNEVGCDRDYMELKTDNNVIEGDFDSSIDPCALFTDSGIYSRSHNNITKVIDNVTTVQDIVNLTFTELKLKDADGNVEVYTR